MDESPATSTPHAGSGTHITPSWCSVCERIFDGPDLHDPRSSSGRLRLRSSDFLKPDALNCSLCASVNPLLQATLRERHDGNIEVVYYHQGPRDIIVSYEHEDLGAMSRISRRLIPESC